MGDVVDNRIATPYTSRTISERDIVFAEKSTHPRFTDLEGREFGRWLVLGFAGKNKFTKSEWWCKCECGTIRAVVAQSLTNGVSVSCDCHRRELISELRSTHGATKGAGNGGARTPEYMAWRGMKSRCLNPKHKNAKEYSERGITICPEWIASFEQFLADMGPRPSKYHSVDRKNNNKGYSKDNCHWATKKEQSQNRRSNVMVTAFGKTRCMAEWARDLGTDQSTLNRRRDRGWCDECAVSIKPRSGICPHITD